jgi:hypothetical protein
VAPNSRPERVGHHGGAGADGQLPQTSAQQGAGETAVGGTAPFAGSLGTQVVKVFKLAVARPGLRDQNTRETGLDPVTVG